MINALQRKPNEFSCDCCICGGDFEPDAGVGGIVSGQDAATKKRLGASAVQVYSGMIYQGPSLIADCVREWVHTR